MRKRKGTSPRNKLELKMAAIQGLRLKVPNIDITMCTLTTFYRKFQRDREENKWWVNGLHLYSAFIQSTLQSMPLIHPFTHTFRHQQRLAAMQGTNQLIRSNWGLGVLLRDTSTRPGWDRTGNPLTARRQLLPPEPHHPAGSLPQTLWRALYVINVTYAFKCSSKEIHKQCRVPFL